MMKKENVLKVYARIIRHPGVSNQQDDGDGRSIALLSTLSNRRSIHRAIGTIAGFLTLLLCISIGRVNSQTFPLRISANHRYLEGQDGTPFFLNIDAAWSMVAQLTYAQANTYLTDRANRKFSGVLVNLIEHQFSNNAPNNIYNVAPFTGATFSTPNEPYFVLADSMIARANALGLLVILDASYLGYNCGTEGWCAEVKAASAATMKGWGQYVGNRYKNYPNIIWIMGGDTDPTTVKAKLDSMVVGMKQYDTVYPRIYTAHNDPETQSITRWPGSTWLTLNGIYTYSTTLYSAAQTAYAVSPAMPFIMMESNYENEHSSTPQQLRAQAYWTSLGGGCGHIFGNNPIWDFASGWKTALSSAGSVSMTYFYNLFNSRHWNNLIPATGATIITSGAGSGTTLATFAYASDSSSIIGYLPTQRTVTINPSVLQGDSIHVWWYNPSNGVYTDAGMDSKVSRSYTPPSAGDWVLALDGKGFDFDQTGVGSFQNLPNEFSLSQNYPNPFNPATTIAYNLPRRVHVTLDLYNNLGQLVQRIVDTIQNAGYHQTSLDGRQLSSGVYLYRLQAGEFIQTRKLLLLK